MFFSVHKNSLNLFYYKKKNNCQCKKRKIRKCFIYGVSNFRNSELFKHPDINSLLDNFRSPSRSNLSIIIRAFSFGVTSSLTFFLPLTS